MSRYKNTASLKLVHLEQDLKAVCAAMKNLANRFHSSYPPKPGEAGISLQARFNSKNKKRAFEPYNLEWVSYEFRRVKSQPGTDKKRLKLFWLKTYQRFPRSFASRRPEIAEAFREFNEHRLELLKRRKALIKAWNAIHESLPMADDSAREKTKQIIEAAKNFGNKNRHIQIAKKGSKEKMPWREI